MVLEQYIANEYLRALIILIIVFIIIKVPVYVIKKIIAKWSTKTKTDIDNIIIKKANAPITWIILLLGLKMAIDEISAIKNIPQVDRFFSTVIVVLIFYILIISLNLAIDRWGKKWATRTKSQIDDNLIILLKRSLKVVGGILALLYVLSVWGIEITPLLASLGIAGIAVAFALQATLSNIFGGISLILDKTIKVGDTVFIDQETRGTIMDIGLRSTKIRTFDNELIIMPNGKLADMRIQNIALPEPKSRVVIQFGVAYGSDIDKVKKIIYDEIKKIEGIANEPDVLVRFTEMADSALLFKVYFFMNLYTERFMAIDEANTRIYNALNKHKISIPFPQMDVHLKKE